MRWMQEFAGTWNEAALTSLGFFWMALWAFALGYFISSLIQVLVTRARMQRLMGESGPRSMAIGTFFGFVSSSCSFAALSTTRALFQKGAGLAPSLAFLLASTNLVIELGIVIAIFLGWQFVAGEYVGGILLILFAWGFVRLTRPERLVAEARERVAEMGEEGESEDESWREKITTRAGWERIARRYVMEWSMVWKDVLIGFTVAGVISAFVPDAFFEAMFLGSGGPDARNPGFLAVLQQTLVGPMAAFLTFIGSMGNIPLAALLFGHGVSFAGVMAFIFSDLVVLPVLRINAGYYGWKMALYILLLLLCGLVVVSLAMHYGLAALGMLPESAGGNGPADRQLFAIDYRFFLNLAFLALSGLLGFLWWRSSDAAGSDHHGGESERSWNDLLLRAVAVAAIGWLVGGVAVGPIVG